MKPSLVSRTLRKLLIGEKQAVFIWGSPGSGKSAVVNQLAAELEIALRDIRALLLDPVDLRGLPFVGKDGRSQWATPDFLPQAGEGSIRWICVVAEPVRSHRVRGGCAGMVRVG